MSNRVMPVAAITTAVVGLGAAGMLTAQAVPTAVPSAGSTEVVAGSMSPTTFQSSLLRAFEAKKAADLNAMREAVVANWVAQAEAARIAAEEAAAAAAAAQAAQAAQSTSASYAAPVAAASTSAATTTTAAADTSGASGDVAAWANSSKAMSVKSCESGNNYSTNTGNGYYGAWQFDIPSWLANGGGAYAATPDQAPAWAQDQVAYNYYQSAGWGPWSCG